MIPETTKNYYELRSDVIKDLFINKVQENIDNYEPFIRVGVTKSMIRVKYEHDLENENVNYGDIIDMIIDESIESIIYSSIIKSPITKEVNMFLTNQMPKSSASEITEYLDYVGNFQYMNDVIKQMDSIKYLYFGQKHIPFITYITNSKSFEGCVAEYKGIRMFYVEKLEDIYMSTAPVVDLNTVDIKYNEYIKEEYDNYPIDSLYEEISAEFKRGVITLNCYLGDIKMLKVNTIFGNCKAFMIKIKLTRILKY